MVRWVNKDEALRLDPDFFDRQSFQDGWFHNPAKSGYYSTNYGFAEQRFIVGDNNKIQYGRVCGGETPNINAVAWFEYGGNIYVGVVKQARPFADIAYGIPADEPIVYAQPVMGFRHHLSKIAGDGAARVYESAEDGATREALEEAGVRDVISIKSMGQHWGNPTGPLVTPTDLLEIEIDPDTLSDELDHEELIYGCDYIDVRLLIQRIALGEYEGVNYRASVAMNTFFVFFSRHPEALAS